MFGETRLPGSAEQSVIDRAPRDGVSDHAMTGSYRVIVARYGERARTWYYGANDPHMLKAALRRHADEWFYSLARAGQ